MKRMIIRAWQAGCSVESISFSPYRDKLNIEHCAINRT